MKVAYTRLVYSGSYHSFTTRGILPRKGPGPEEVVRTKT